MNHSVCMLLVKHFTVKCSVLNNMAQVEYVTQQHVCLVQLYFKYESAGECCKEFQC